MFKEVKADKDELSLSLRIYKDEDTYKIDAYGWTYDYENKVTDTLEYASATGTFTHGTEGRTFSFEMASTAGISDFTSKDVTLGEDENGLYIIIEDLNKTGSSPAEGSGLVATTDYPLHNNEKMYTDADKTTNPTSIGTAYLSYDAAHLAHTWYAMKNSLGFKTWNINATQNSAVTATHYKACECGIAYLEEECVQKSDGTALNASSESTSVCYLCGYNGYTGKYVNCQIGEQTTFTNNEETLLIPAESVITLPYSTYQIFNGKNVSIDGWTGFVNAVNSGSGKVKVTTDKAVLTFSLDT